MGNIYLTNKNAGRNIVCWNCEHFQPSRDPSVGPPRGAPSPSNYCNGECRKNSPAFDWEFLQTGIIAADVIGFFPFVPLGNTAWCSGFQRAIEPLPAPVVSGANNCSDIDPINWFTPDQNNGIDTYRKVPAENSCWYCEHFQPDETSATCKGYCCHEPPMTYAYGIPGGPSPLAQQFHFPTVEYSYYKWCSKWERSTQPVPAPPEQAGKRCYEIPPP